MDFVDGFEGVRPAQQRGPRSLMSTILGHGTSGGRRRASSHPERDP
jgi:hypothetical protein